MTKKFIIFHKALWRISPQGIGGVSRNPINVTLSITFLKPSNIEGSARQIEANHHQQRAEIQVSQRAMMFHLFFELCNHNVADIAFLRTHYSLTLLNSSSQISSL
jgi:hypothetical protein